MKDTRNITIRIGDVPPISMTVKHDGEQVVREAERAVNRVWGKWCEEFSHKTSQDVMAMVALQFAKLYFEQQHSVENTEKLLAGFEAQLDRMLEITADPAVEDAAGPGAQSAGKPRHPALR